jgi:hypothetical protein
VEASAETVQTTNATLGTVVGGQMITDLPLNTRNYTNILALSAGANASVNNATALGKGSQDIAVNGAATSQNNFLMDGVSVVNFGGFGLTGEGGSYAGLSVPNPDTLAEFKIQTSLYDAGYGRNPGANVNVITKSGTNQFHGTLFYFFRNTKLNANDFFLNRAGVRRPDLNQNQYGLTIGGPIKKDKLFFFFSFQETGQRNAAAGAGFASGVILPPIPDGDRGTTSLSGIDNAAAAAFRQNLGAAICPNNHPGDNRYRTAFGGVQVACDGSTINDVAMRLLQAKLPNGNYVIPGSGTGTFTPRPFTVPAIYNEHQFMGNGDYIVNSKNTVATRYYYQTTPQTQPFAVGCGVTCLPGFPGKFQFSTTSAVLKLTSILTNSLVNEARTSFLRNVTDDQPLHSFTNSQFGITPLVPTIPGLSTFSVSGLFRLGGSNFDQQTMYVNQFQWGDQLSWTKGKHTVRTGFEIERIQWNWNFPSLSKGLPIINTFPDFLIGRPGCAPGDGACLGGAPSTTNGVPNNNTVFSNIFVTALATRTNGSLIHAYRGLNSATFVQDDIKLTSKLTINLGLRWEFNGLVTDKYGYLTSVFPSLIQTVPIPTTATFAGFTVPANYRSNPANPPLPSSVTVRDHDIAPRNRTPLDNFAPRFGFAWQPIGGNRFVVRGGFGMFYNRIPGNSFIQSVQEAQPYAGPAGAAATANYYSHLAVPFAPGGPGWLSPRLVNLTAGTSSNVNPATVQEIYVTPVTYSWNLNFQYEFLPKWVLELGYVGSHGIHQNSTHAINLARLASPTSPLAGGAITTNTVANVPLRVPYLGFASAFNQESTDGDYKFNSLQVTVRKQMSYGLSMQGAYTFSRAFTNIPRNSNDPEDSRQSYGLNQQYRPHRFVLNYSWNIPYGNRKGAAGAILGGWNLSGVTTIQGGTPLSLFDTAAGTIYGAPSNTGRATINPGFTYADLITPGEIRSNLNNYFNRAAFGVPPAIGNGRGWGNMGVSNVFGPGQLNFDVSLTKTTKVGGLREDATLQFRAEFFNLFNHAQFANPANIFGQGNFGLITATSVNPRLIQFALKYAF